MSQRTIYVPDEIWRPLRAKCAMEGIAVSAWIRQQAAKYVNGGADICVGEAASENDNGETVCELLTMEQE